jgi:hypothetical protein
MRKKSSKTREFRKIDNEKNPEADFQNESSEFQSSIFVPVSPAFTDQSFLNPTEGGVISPMAETDNDLLLPAKETLASFVEKIVKNRDRKSVV